MYTKEQEVELLQKYKNQDPEAIDKLAAESTRLALAIAARYTDRDSEEYPLYVSTGVKGFYRAIDPFLENNRDDKFTSYSLYFIKKEIEKIEGTKKIADTEE
ncbi:hypothetical protein KBA63_02075 [Candidatus Woesebacteria bacterium]|nr:hypothetical protein [Candidatus Woesebacteria bacterium]MBP9687906.1 hypothetical protein [Candidatus Woesebacteria bacterium]